MNAAFQPIVLTPHQQAAFDALAAFTQGPAGAAVLEGYAGCGKTVMVGQLVEHLHHQGRRVVIAAPTNKAVAVLAAKVPVPVEAATVHSLLGLRLKDRGDG